MVDAGSVTYDRTAPQVVNPVISPTIARVGQVVILRFTMNEPAPQPENHTPKNGTVMVDTPRPGAPAGNLNALKTGEPSLSIPISEGRLVLGIWQGIFLWEHRHQAGVRTIVAHLST